MNHTLDARSRRRPEEAAITPNVACTPRRARRLLGRRRERRDRRGAGRLARRALAGGDGVRRARKGWHVLEFARPHCPFSFAMPAPTEAGASDCVAYNQRRDRVARRAPGGDEGLRLQQRAAADGGARDRVPARGRHGARCVRCRRRSPTCGCCATRRPIGPRRTTAWTRVAAQAHVRALRGAAQARSGARSDGRVRAAARAHA